MSQGALPVFLSVCRFERRSSVTAVCSFRVSPQECLDEALRLAMMLADGSTLMVAILGEEKWTLHVTPRVRAAAAWLVRVEQDARLQEVA